MGDIKMLHMKRDRILQLIYLEPSLNSESIVARVIIQVFIDSL